jgi:hypothetical protein
VHFAIGSDDEADSNLQSVAHWHQQRVRRCQSLGRLNVLTPRTGRDVEHIAELRIAGQSLPHLAFALF